MAPHSTPASYQEVLQEIDALLDEIQLLSDSPMAPSDYFRRVLEGLRQTSDGLGAGVFSADSLGGLQLVYRNGLEHLLNPASRVKLGKHYRRLGEALQVGAPTYLPRDRSASCTNGSLVVPIETAGRPWGLLLLEVAPGFPEGSQDGVLRFMAEAALHIGHFLERQEARYHHEHHEALANLTELSLSIHQRVGLRETAYRLANDGRACIGSDRVVVASVTRRRCRVLAVSGVEEVQRRSDLVRSLERLIVLAARGGEPFVYEDGDPELPTPLQRRLDSYLEQSGSRGLAVFPLRWAKGDNGSPGAPIGALVCELFHGGELKQLLPKAHLVSRHGSLAMTNALRRSLVPGTALLRSGSMPTALAKSFAKIAIVAAAVVGLAALLMMPTDFMIRARGELRPEMQRHVFATMGGSVREVLARHGDEVVEGDALIEMRSPDLELQMERAWGAIQTYEEQLVSIAAERLEVRPDQANAQTLQGRLTSEERLVRVKLASERKQFDVLQEREEELRLRAPITGTVTTWEVEKRLRNRPVEPGDTLLTVSDLRGPWVLRVDVPDRSVGHVIQAQKEQDSPLKLDFVSAGDPEERREGTVRGIALESQVYERDGESCVRLEADFDREALGYVSPGSAVRCRIHCGRRPLGYVWLREFYEELCRRFF